MESTERPKREQPKSKQDDNVNREPAILFYMTLFFVRGLANDFSPLALPAL